MRKKISARRVAFTAVFTALSVAFLYIAYIFPTGQLGFLGLASLAGIAAVVEYGTPGGLFVWLGTSVLGLLILPSKSLVWLYAVFFGPYPVVKALSEGLRRVLEWCVKMAFFDLALTVAIFVLRFTMLSFDTMRFGTLILYVLGNAVFVAFDIAVSRAIVVYMKQLHPKIHK